MLISPADSLQAIQSLAGDFKFWTTLGACVVAVYKAYDWVKQIRTKDIPEMHSEIKKLSVSIDVLGSKLDAQTTSVVGELKEMRSDFRTFYISPSPLMMAARAKAPVKRKSKPRTKAPVKDLTSAV